MAKHQLDLRLTETKEVRLKSIIVILLASFVTLSATAAQLQCAAYCLDVRTQSNPQTKQKENHFNRSPLIRAANFQTLISKCQMNFGTALVLNFKYKKARNSSSILTEYKSAKAQTACKSI